MRKGDQILEMVASKTGLSKTGLLDKAMRSNIHTKARCVAIKLLTEAESQAYAAEIMGVDVSNVSRSLGKFQDLIFMEADYRNIYNTIKDQL